MPTILSACPEPMLSHVKSMPLEAQFCSDCQLGFNSMPLTGEDLTFIYDSYLYISPLHGIGTGKYEGMLHDLTEYFAKDDRVVEIGCSEGYLLKQLLDKGYTNLLGIEPGPQAEKAKELGIPIRKEYFTGNTFADKKIDGFFLMHVFEHFPDPFEILRSMCDQLSPTGKIIVEVPDFDGYHHQHLFYYNLPFFYRMCNDLEMKIIKYTIDKNALRVVITHQQAPYAGINLAKNETAVIERVNSIKSATQSKFKQIKDFLEDNQGKKVYWWGAGSSSVIILNQIKSYVMDKIAFEIIDGDKNKWGLFIPGINIKVEPFTKLAKQEIDCLVIASSFFKEIEKTLQNHQITVKQMMVVY